MASKNKVKVEISRGKYVESNQLKKLSFKRVLRSFKFSFDGLKYAYLHEQSLILHVVVMVLIVTCGISFKITPIQWVITLVMGALILVAELFNTAIEAVVDMVTEEFHPLAKVAKDTASAACFIADMTAAGMWLVVFVPKIIALFR
ncbi:MAG: diacylglycerol kinase [Bacilli bacterium]|jgi:hypothetical protein|nr:diacylglycerol kinase [Bacilli bacterium]